MGSVRRWAAAAFGLLALTGASGDDAADAGAQIYLRGVGRAPVTAHIAGGSVEMPGKLFPCVNCHKADGLGHLEGGLRPRDVTWPTLTNASEAGGRGYDAGSLRRAIGEGLDAHGGPLASAMPRYRMDEADLTAIVAYLRTMDEAATPGVTGEDVQVATLLPLRGSLADTARLVERFLNLAVRDINTRRRFDGRRITLASVAFDADVPGDALRAAQEAVATHPPFAFLANYGVAAGDAAHAFIAGAGIPNIAPLAAPDTPDDRSAVWIEPSVADQARALVDAASSMAADGRDGARPKRGPARLALVWSGEAGGQAAAAAATAEAARLGATLALEQHGFDGLPDLVARLRRADIDELLVFGPYGDAAAMLGEASRQAWRPTLLGRRQQLEAIEQDRTLQRAAEIFLVTSYGGIQPRSPGAYDFRRVAGELGGGHPELLRDAYVGAKLLETALATTGRRLTRPGLLASLGRLNGFATGVMAPLSFGAGASRRQAASVMRLDPDRGRLVPLTPERTP